MNNALTPKQENFCHKYLETGNASEAYRQCYDCSKMKPESINRKAKELMENVKITARVKQLQDDLVLKSDIKKEEVLDQLSAIMESKITDYVIFNGRTIKFRDFSKLTDRQIKAIESIKKGKNGIELKLHGKSWTIERICKMLGYDAPVKKELTGKDGKDLIPTDFSSLETEEVILLHNLLEKANGKSQ